jgi:inorganic pyrophosphatase
MSLCRNDTLYPTISELPEHQLKAVKRFFEDYKALENKKVKVEKFMGRYDALNIIEQSIKLYKDLRPQLLLH